MTLLGTMLATNAVYIGGDQSQMREDNNSGVVSEIVQSEKLWKYHNLPIVMGYYGEVGIGNDIRKTISQDDPVPLWRSLSEYLAQVVEDANDGHDSQTKTGLLVAGYLEGRAQYLEVDSTGQARFPFALGSRPYHFSGNGRIAARVAYEVASRCQPNRTAQHRFTTAFETTIEHVDILGGELSLWIIPEAGEPKQIKGHRDRDHEIVTTPVRS